MWLVFVFGKPLPPYSCLVSTSYAVGQERLFYRSLFMLGGATYFASWEVQKVVQNYALFCVGLMGVLLFLPLSCLH